MAWQLAAAIFGRSVFTANPSNTNNDRVAVKRIAPHDSAAQCIVGDSCLKQATALMVAEANAVMQNTFAHRCNIASLGNT